MCKAPPLFGPPDNQAPVVPEYMVISCTALDGLAAAVNDLIVQGQGWQLVSGAVGALVPDDRELQDSNEKVNRIESLVPGYLQTLVRFKRAEKAGDFLVAQSVLPRGALN